MAKILLVAQILVALLCQSSAYEFYVGGRAGWSLNPSQNYNSWAQRNRFQVNDKLVFNYNKGDLVLLVNKEDYDSCDTSNPVQRMENGSSVFQLNRSGHFFFISGSHDRCEKGEKMVATVMAMRTPPALPVPFPPSSSPSSLPSASSPSPSISEGPSFGGASAPGPAPLPDQGGETSFSCVNMASFGLVAAILAGVCFI